MTTRSCLQRVLLLFIILCSIILPDLYSIIVFTYFLMAIEALRFESLQRLVSCHCQIHNWTSDSVSCGVTIPQSALTCFKSFKKFLSLSDANATSEMLSSQPAPRNVKVEPVFKTDLIAISRIRFSCGAWVTNAPLWCPVIESSQPRSVTPYPKRRPSGFKSVPKFGIVSFSVGQILKNFIPEQQIRKSRPSALNKSPRADVLSIPDGSGT